MKFSIIIINYKTKELTTACINSILKNFIDGEYEVMVVDNGSQDGSVGFLEKEFRNKIIIISNEQNLGFGSANNIGSKKAKGEFLFFLNSDTLITSDFLGVVFDAFQKNKSLGAVAPKLIMENGEEQTYAYGKFPSLFSLFVKRHRDEKNANKNDVDWLSGAALIIKKKLFEKVGGFDENFFMYFEDMDLCRRVKDLGFKNMTIPAISLVHLAGRSSENFSRKKMYYKSQSYYFKKHCGLLAMLFLNLIRWPYKIFLLNNHHKVL
jgi:GT2 family glycosyltransferase